MAVLKIKNPKAPKDLNLDSIGGNSTTKRSRVKTKASLGVTSDDNSAMSAKGKLKINLRTKDDDALKLKINLKKSDKTDRRPPRLRLKPIRVPGEGYDSEASDVEEDPLVESGVILRLLPDVQVEYLKNSIETGDYSGINLVWKGHRHAILYINGFMYGALLVDLPTMIEVNKNVDKKTLMKTFDVTQMLLCIRQIANEDEVFELVAPDTEDLVSKHFSKDVQQEIIENKKHLYRIQRTGGILALQNDPNNNKGLENEPDHKYLDQIATKNYDYRHGITPPLYNVRNRRFRRKLTGKEFEYVESVVEMLLRDDDNSEDVYYDLVNPDEVADKATMVITADVGYEEDTDDTTIHSHNDTSSIANIRGQEETSKIVAKTLEYPSTGPAEDEDELDLDQAFQSDEEAGEGGSRQSEDDDEDDEDDDEEDEDDEDEDDEITTRENTPAERRQHAALLQDELEELKSTLEHTRTKLHKATNPLMRMRFAESIKKLEKAVEVKLKQLDQQDPNSHRDSEVEDEEEMMDEDDEDDEDEGRIQQEGVNTSNSTPASADTPDIDIPIANTSPAYTTTEDAPIADGAADIDQNDVDMMILFGAEGDE